MAYTNVGTVPKSDSQISLRVQKKSRSQERQQVKEGNERQNVKVDLF